MKSLFFLLVLCVSANAIAQPSPNSAPYPYALTGQMLNLSNTHPGASNDTSTGTLYLTTAKYNTSNLPALYPVVGSGNISFITSCLKASTTSTVNPTVVSTPQGSFDGVNWANIPGVTAATVTPTSATVPLTTKWEFTANQSVYYRIKNVVTNDTASVKTYYFFNKTFTYGNK